MTSPALAPTRDCRRWGQGPPVQPAGSRKAHTEEPGRWASTQAGGPEAAPSRQDPIIEPLPVSKPRDGNGLLCFVDYFLHLIRMLIWFNGCIKAVNLWDLCLIHTVSISEVSTGVWQ